MGGQTMVKGPPFSLQGTGGGGCSICREQIIYFNSARQRAKKSKF